MHSETLILFTSDSLP